MTNIIDELMEPRVTVPLSTPISIGDAKVSELVFREPNVGDLIVGDQMNGSLAKTVAVLASMSGIPMPVFKTIRGKDFQQIVDKTVGLLGNVKKVTTGN